MKKHSPMSVLHPHVAQSWLALGLTLSLVGACSSSHPDDGAPAPDDLLHVTDGGGVDHPLDAHVGIGDSGSARLDAGHTTHVFTLPDGALPSPEICDGIDNDGDGEIDDIDVGNDGICDCLLLATLGVPGTWGQGDVFAEWLSSRSNTGATSLDGKPLTAQLLAPYQVIVAQDLRATTYSDAEIAVLQDWVHKGGGLFTLIGYGDSTERTTVNRILLPTGIQYGATAEFGNATSGNTMPITTWHTHPVSEGITQIGAFNGYEVSGGGTVVAEEGGIEALRAAELGAGHVLVWGDEWITYNSEWQSHPDYQVERFWLNAIKWLSPPRECQVTIPYI